VISDTHGSLPDDVSTVFEGVDHIVHAGDVGHDAVLLALEAIAPVTAVRGNMDRTGPTAGLPDEVTLGLAGVDFDVRHTGPSRPRPPDGRPLVVVRGHTHVPTLTTADGVLHVNPGSATRPPTGRGPTVAIVVIGLDGVEASIEPLDR
jgi:putative phosphoesterase